MQKALGLVDNEDEGAVGDSVLAAAPKAMSSAATREPAPVITIPTLPADPHAGATEIGMVPLSDHEEPPLVAAPAPAPSNTVAPLLNAPGTPLALREPRALEPPVTAAVADDDDDVPAARHARMSTPSARFYAPGVAALTPQVLDSDDAPPRKASLRLAPVEDGGRRNSVAGGAGTPSLSRPSANYRHPAGLEDDGVVLTTSGNDGGAGGGPRKGIELAPRPSRKSIDPAAAAPATAAAAPSPSESVPPPAPTSMPETAEESPEPEVAAAPAPKSSVPVAPAAAAAAAPEHKPEPEAAVAPAPKSSAPPPPPAAAAAAAPEPKPEPAAAVAPVPKSSVPPPPPAAAAAAAPAPKPEPEAAAAPAPKSSAPPPPPTAAAAAAPAPVEEPITYNGGGVLMAGGSGEKAPTTTLEPSAASKPEHAAALEALSRAEPVPLPVPADAAPGVRVVPPTEMAQPEEPPAAGGAGKRLPAVPPPPAPPPGFRAFYVPAFYVLVPDDTEATSKPPSSVVVNLAPGATPTTLAATPSTIRR
mgnify:CR=1 FL=1